MNVVKRIAIIFAGLILVVTLVLAGLIVFGTAPPPRELVSVSDPMRHIDFSDLPALAQFVARDGQALHYRLYPGSADTIVVLIHGSAGESSGMHALAKTLRAGGETVYVPDLRGHGHDGSPGDIDYIGQLDDDLADFVAVIRQSHPVGGIALVGHSSGGGYVLRVAEGPDAHLFSRFILISPALAIGSPTYRPDVGGWATPFVGRIVALRMLNRLGLRWFNGLPIVAFAVDRHASVPLDSTYSYRMLANFSAPADSITRLASVTKPLAVLVGNNDELFYADRFAPLFRKQRLDVTVIVVPGVNHMGMVTAPLALATVAKVVAQLPPAATNTNTYANRPIAAPGGLAILEHTPWWVFVVLAVLLITGIQALRPRVVAVWRLFLVPAVFIAWGVFSVVQRSAAVPVLALDWSAAVALGALIGWATTRLDGFVFDVGAQSVHVPGTPMPLTRNIVIFLARYGIAVAAALAATAALRAHIVVWDVAVSGLATGYFLGWLGRFVRLRYVH